MQWGSTSREQSEGHLCIQSYQSLLATAMNMTDTSPVSESSKTGAQIERKMSKALNPKTSVMRSVTSYDFYRIAFQLI